MQDTWDGKTERRKCEQGWSFCSAHQQLEINSALFRETLEGLRNDVKEIKEGISEATKVRVNWWISLAGTVLLVLVQAGILCYYMGQMSKQIDINTSNIASLREEANSVAINGSTILRERIEKIENEVYKKSKQL